MILATTTNHELNWRTCSNTTTQNANNLATPRNTHNAQGFLPMTDRSSLVRY